MEEDKLYLEDLEAALDEKHLDLESRCIPVIKEAFRKYHHSFKNYYNVLVKKSVITEDPYKFEQKISTIEIPPKGPITDSEKTEEMGMRLSALESQLDFLNNYYQLNTEELNLKQIKLLAGLCQYILWDRMSPGSSNLNTRVLYELADKVKQGSDSLSAGILGDAQSQMASLSREIMAALKEILFYHKQRYKNEVRRNVLPTARIDSETIQNQRDMALKKIKRAYAEKMASTPYFPELINEVLDEDFSANGEALRNDILSQLQVIKQEKEKKPTFDYKSILLDAVKTLGSSGSSLYNAGLKMTGNLTIMQTRKTSFSEKFRRWLQKVVQKTEQSTIYEVEYFDEKTSTSKTMRLDIKQFIEQTLKKGKLLSTLSNRLSSRYQKLEKADESDIYTFLEKQIMETQTLFHTLSAVDTFFKTEVQREKRKQIKGLKLEISSIKSNLLKANQKRYEYVSRKDEMEQLKKLGIDVDSD